MGSTRRTVLAAGVAAAAAAVVPRGFAQQTGKGKFYQRGSVRIYYEETGSGFPHTGGVGKRWHAPAN